MLVGERGQNLIIMTCRKTQLSPHYLEMYHYQIIGEIVEKLGILFHTFSCEKHLETKSLIKYLVYLKKKNTSKFPCKKKTHPATVFFRECDGHFYGNALCLLVGVCSQANAKEAYYMTPIFTRVDRNQSLSKLLSFSEPLIIDVKKYSCFSNACLHTLFNKRKHFQLIFIFYKEFLNCICHSNFQSCWRFCCQISCSIEEKGTRCHA